MKRPQTGKSTGVLRDAKGRIVKGSGAMNPGGLAAWQREVKDLLQTNSRAAIELLGKVIAGKRLRFTDDFGEKVFRSPSLGQRIKACETVLEFSVPRPKTWDVSKENEGEIDVSKLKQNDLDKLEEILDRAAQSTVSNTH